MPSLTTSFGQLNRFFNMGAYNPGGREELTGANTEQDRSSSQGPSGTGRKEGFLYWLAWVAQSGVSLHQNADARGPIRRVTLCTASAQGIFIDPAIVLAGLAGGIDPAVLGPLLAAANSTGLIGPGALCPE
jgi:hypothetical protein